jgi:hypothetical protein
MDAVASATVLVYSYGLGRGHELTQTLGHFYSVLSDGTYSLGALYYPSPDCCLGFFLGAC